MNNQPFYRCYYDDGTIELSESVCPATTQQGSPLIASELTLITDVNKEITWPWLLLVLGMIILSTNNKRK